jgi:hypothetical protein
MDLRYTKQQVVRGTRPDAEDFNKFLLIRWASKLRPTYQIRLLTYRAVSEHRKLVIEVPRNCKFQTCRFDVFGAGKQEEP